MVNKCLVCGEKAMRIKYASNNVRPYYCDGFHRKLVEVYGYFNKNGFNLGSKGKYLLKKFGRNGEPVV